MDILYVVSNGKGANDRVAVKQAALAEQTFHTYYVALQTIDKYTEAELIEMSGDAAAAEVRFYFH